jgi:coproporphyrinogen III oxidase-like Fe-S oxidoreductase
MASLPSGDPAPLDGLLPANALVDSHARTLHAYLHIPFCRVRCGYCDFNTYTSSELRGVTQNSFLDNLSNEISFSRSVIERSGLPERELSSIFFGGGTPTQLEAKQLASALQQLKGEFGVIAGAEVTTEANPDNVDEEYFETLAAAGFNRVSIGMQSAVPEVLVTLDRTHNPENVAKAVQAARKNGLQLLLTLFMARRGRVSPTGRFPSRLRCL